MNVVSIAAGALIAGIVAVAIVGSRSVAPDAPTAKSQDERGETVTASATTTVRVTPRDEGPVPPAILEALRADTRWQGLDFFGVASTPFVSVRALPTGTPNEAPNETPAVAESIAARDAAIAQAVRDLWTRSFGPLPAPVPGERPLVRLILPDRARFALAYDAEEHRMFEASDATFCGADGTAYIGRSPRDTTEPLPCGESSMQSTCDLMSASAAAAQLLLDARSRAPQSAATPPQRAFWFERGLVLWLSGIETARGSDADRDPGHVATNRLHLEYIQLVRGSGRANADDSLREAARSWTIPRLLDLRSDADSYRVVGPSSFPRQIGRAVMWGFVHFLWNYDGGRYRETLRATLAADLRGEDTTAAFRRAMAAIEPATEKGDWTVVQREFWWYWDKLLARGVGWKTKSRLDWWRTPTTPPEGRWAPPPDEPEEDEAADDEETK